MSPPEAPKPATPLGWPAYWIEQAWAPEPPAWPIPRQPSLPPPRPRSEPTKTLLAADTCAVGSPSWLVPQPEDPATAEEICPKEKVPEVAAAASPWRACGLAAPQAEQQAGEQHDGAPEGDPTRTEHSVPPNQ